MLIISIVFVLALLLRLAFLSQWLEDWDSVQFALALHNFSIVEHQPHPPGYPLYIFLGRVLNLFLNNDTLSLTLLSSLLGALSTIPMFLLLKNFVSRKLAILSSIIFIFTPLYWSLSEVALSNIPGTFFTITTAYFLYKGKDKLTHLLLGSFLGGLTLGIRFAEWSIVIALIVLVTIYRKSWVDSLKTCILFVCGIVLWLIPLIIDTGLSSFIGAYTKQLSYIISHDSFVQYTSILDRLSRIWELFIMGYSIYFVPLLIFITWHMIRKHRFIKEWSYSFSIVWFLSYLIPLIFIYNLEVPRHLLQLLPPLVLLSALVMQNIIFPYTIPLTYTRLQCYHVAIAGMVIIVIMLFLTSLSYVKQQKNLIPPSIAPILYVKENFGPQNTTIIASFTYRQFQYYAPEFEIYYGNRNVENLQKEILITDQLGLMEQKAALVKYNIVEERQFNGPENIFPRLPQTKLYVLKR